MNNNEENWSAYDNSLSPQENIMKLINKLTDGRLDEALKEITKNEDLRVKELGDIVTVWDTSFNKDSITGEKRDDSIIFKQNAIVIDTECNIKCEVPSLITINGITEILEVDLDLLLRFPNGTEMYCSSKCVKRIDDDEI